MVVSSAASAETMPCPGSTTPTSAIAISSDTAICGFSTNSSSCASSRSRMLAGNAAGNESNQFVVMSPTSEPVTSSTPTSTTTSGSRASEAFDGASGAAALEPPAPPAAAADASSSRRSRRRRSRVLRLASASPTLFRVAAPGRGLRTCATSVAPFGRLRREASSSVRSRRRKRRRVGSSSAAFAVAFEPLPAAFATGSGSAGAEVSGPGAAAAAASSSAPRPFGSFGIQVGCSDCCSAAAASPLISNPNP